VLLLGLVALALVAPLRAAVRAECGMACCRTAALHRAACASAATCALSSCTGAGEAAELPSLPVSTLPVPPRLQAPEATGSLASLPPSRRHSLPQARPERPPRA
jgi:hypothetical protein